MATVNLIKKTILATDAQSDQEHISMLVDNDPQMPDCTEVPPKAKSPKTVRDLAFLVLFVSRRMPVVIPEGFIEIAAIAVAQHGGNFFYGKVSVFQQ